MLEIIQSLPLILNIFILWWLSVSIFIIVANYSNMKPELSGKKGFIFIITMLAFLFRDKRIKFIWIPIGLVILSFSLYYLNKPTISPTDVTEKSPELYQINKKVDNTWISISVNGRDDSSRVIGFNILVLTKEFSWVYNSTKSIKFNDELISDFRPYLKTSGLQNQIKNSIDIICVGMASCEGKIQKEEKRAELRALQLYSWINQCLPESNNPDIPLVLYTLNLGRYLTPCESNKEDAHKDQRSVILIRVVTKEPAANIHEALQDAMDNLESLNFSTKDYSKFNLIKMT